MSDNISSIVSYIPTNLRSGPKNTLSLHRIVLHITGRSTYLNAEKHKLAPLVHLGVNNFLIKGKSFSHYAVDPWGYIGVYAPESICPQSQGWKAFGGPQGILRDLASGERRLPAWWQEVWGRVQVSKKGEKQDLGFVKSPVDLLLGDAGPNSGSASIEFIQYGNQFLLTEAQCLSGNLLVRDICTRNLVPFKAPNVLGHEDLNPWTRADKGGGWDPGARRVEPRFCWDCFFSANLYQCKSTDTNILCKYILKTPDQPAWTKL